MNCVPHSASLDPIEIAVWAAEFVRARGSAIPPLDALTNIDHALKCANAAIGDLRKAYKR